MSADQPELEPEQEAVRRLLADPSLDAGPLTDDVAARLDRTLAELVAESDAPSAAGAVAATEDAPSDLSTHRRRRRRAAGALVLAAAAVVVVGIGVRAVVGGPSPEQTDMSSDAGADRGAAEGDASPAPSSRPTADGGDLSLQTRPRSDGAPDAEGDDAAVPTIRPLRFVADVRGVRSRLVATDTLDYRSREVREPARFECADADFGRGALVGVDYRSAPAVLAFRRPSSDTQVADLLQCGSGDVVRSTTLALR